MTETLKRELANQLLSYGEVAFMYCSMLVYVQERTTGGFEFDIGERESNEKINHFDGGLFEGSEINAIQNAMDTAEEINLQFREIQLANAQHERDEKRGIA